MHAHTENHQIAATTQATATTTTKTTTPNRQRIIMDERNTPVERLRLHCSEFVDDYLESVDDF
jgi:hypothetical protein